MKRLKTAVLAIALLPGSWQFAFAEEPCDPNPLEPRIESIMKKSFPIMMAWRDGPGEDRFVTAPKKSLATFQKGLLEIHKLRKDTCLDLLQSNVDSEKSGGEPKSCEDVKAMTADYQRQVQQNKEFLKKVQKRKVTLPLLYNLYAEIGMMRIEEAVTLRNDEIKTFNAAVLESRKVWDKNDTAGIYSVEGTLFFALKEAHYARMINEAESRSNELQLVRQNLACE